MSNEVDADVPDDSCPAIADREQPTKSRVALRVLGMGASRGGGGCTGSHWKHAPPTAMAASHRAACGTLD